MTDGRCPQCGEPFSANGLRIHIGMRHSQESKMKTAPTRYTVKYVPVEEGAQVQLGSTGLPNIWGDHKLIGYQPAPLNPRARKPYEPHGWLVVLVNEAVSAPQAARLRARPLKAAG